MEKILNKRKIREAEKYLVQQKGFIVESDTWEKEEDLRNAKELVDDFKGRMGAKVRQQVGERKAEREKYRRMELLGKYMVKLLYGQDDKKFEEEYLEKLEQNWKRQKENRQINENKYLRRIEEREEEEKKKMNKRDWRTGHFSGGKILKGVISRSKNINLVFFIYFYFHFIFLSTYFLFFYFQNSEVRVRSDWSHCHISHI